MELIIHGLQKFIRIVWSALSGALVIIQALAIALIIRTFFFQPFWIPSPSMVPTLLIGDYLFVNKFSYGYSEYSFPIEIDFITDRIFSSLPDRGDVAVFVNPAREEQDYIKRIVGLPGDNIQLRGGTLFVNEVEVTRVADVLLPEYGNTGEIYKEINGDGHEYLTKDIYSSRADNYGPYTVPFDHVFVLGDNRDNSADSRFDRPHGIGPVPIRNLLGRASFIMLSVDSSKADFWQVWRWPIAIRWDRTFSLIK